MFKLCLVLICLGFVHPKTENEEDYFDSLFHEDVSGDGMLNVLEGFTTVIPDYDTSVDYDTSTATLLALTETFEMDTTPMPNAVVSSTTPALIGKNMEKESKFIFIF